MVGIAHHLVEYGVASCVDCCRQLLGIGLSVQRVLHLACLQIAWAGNATGSNQRLRLSVEGQLCHGSGSRRCDVGLVDGECLLHLSAVVADTHDGSLTRADVLVALVAHAEVGVLGKNGLSVLHGDVGCQCLAGVGHGCDVLEADVGMRQQLAVAHRDLGVGALHHEGEGIGVALYGLQLEVLQQVDVALYALGSLHGAASGIPQSLQSAYAPARVGLYRYRYGGAFGSLCHFSFCYVELHATLSVRAHLEVVGGRNDVRPRARHCHHEQCEQTK